MEKASGDEDDEEPAMDLDDFVESGGLDNIDPNRYINLYFKTISYLLVLDLSLLISNQ